jgi:GAF domain-containing protein
MVKQKDLVIRDIEPPQILQLLPEWFKAWASANIFIVLLPIIINNKPVGIFYIEGDKEGYEKVSGSHLNYLKILRDQTVMAIKQKKW